mmetsp:Transcript_39763/g.86020  ORF Transcript_39763/g.86020 Transcript_39763/m.86020 type:complete len:317 (+) Transcript_39763:1332-2282(+)
MHQKSDQASVVGAPADHAITDCTGQSLCGLTHQSQHAGTEICTTKHTHAPVPGLIIDPGVQVFSIFLLVLGFQCFDLLRGLAGHNLNDSLFVGAQAIHCCLQVFTIFVVVNRCFRMSALQNSHQDILEVAAGFGLNVCNQTLVEHPLVGFLDDLSLLEICTNDDSNQLIFGCTPTSHCAMQSSRTTFGPLHGLVCKNLLVAERSLRGNVIYQLPAMLFLIEPMNLVIQIFWKRAHQTSEGVLISAPSMHRIPKVSYIKLHRHVEKCGHRMLPPVCENEEGATFCLAFLLHLILQRSSVDSFIQLCVPLDGRCRHRD